MKEQPRYNVISVRLSDEEMSFLREMSRKDRKRISDIVREALHHEKGVCSLWQRRRRSGDYAP